jgi:hypothetical protein
MTQLRRETTASASAGQADSAIIAGRRTQFLTASRPSLDRAYRLAGLLLGNPHEAEDAVAVASRARRHSTATPVGPAECGRVAAPSTLRG